MEHFSGSIRKGQRVRFELRPGLGSHEAEYKECLPDGRDVVLDSEGADCILPQGAPIEPIDEPPEETGPVTVPPFCHYEICRDGSMELCGADATETGPDLCADHAAFVKDSTVGPFTASKKAHPAGFDWLKKAKAAFGVKPFTMGKPSDAGKKPAPFDPAEIAEWNARAVHYSTDPDIGPYCVLPAFWKGPGPTPTIEIVNVDTPELEHIEPLPVDVYCVQIKVYGEWRTQKAGMEGAAAGNMRDGMARMGYEARVMYGPGVVADPVEIKEDEPEPVFMVEGLNGFTAHTVPATLEQEIHEHVTAGLANVPPEPVVQEEPQTVEAGNGEYTREEIEAACVRLMEERDTYRGTGIPGVLWNVGFRIVYQKRDATPKQIDYIRALMVKAPDKYAPLLAQA